MKLSKPVYCAVALLIIPLLQGCAVLVGGTALAGGTYGAVSYASNTLQTTQKISLDKAWDAANEALKELKMPISSIKKDKKSAKIKAKNAQDQSVVIGLSSKSENETEIQISVGAFDTDANTAAEQRIYDKMHIRF